MLFTEAVLLNRLNAASVAVISGDDRSLQVEQLLYCNSRAVPQGPT